MARKYLIVDGHSIIFHWQELRALHARNARRARAELVRRLTAYQDATDERVVIVFDGKGSRSREVEASPADVQVVYASGGSTADAVIEKLVAQYVGQFELTVATGDEAERMTTSSFGASWVSPGNLRERLDRAAIAARHWPKRTATDTGVPLEGAFPPDSGREEDSK